MTYNPMAYQHYGGQYPSPYGSAYMQPTVAQQVPQGIPTNGITKVRGAESAMQYQLPPNSTSPALFDEGGGTFYIVSTDGTGTKSIEAFDFTPHVEEPPVTVDDAHFVNRDEFDQFVAKVNAALGVINNDLYGPVQAEPAAATDGGAAAGGAAQDGRRRHASPRQ